MEDPQLHIFPTTYRIKHSKELSYPIGAGALSHQLNGVPQHDLITCTFSTGYPQYDDGKPQFHVIHFVYSQRARNFHDGKFAHERGVFDPRWEIRIFTVPRQLCGAIKSILIDRVLPDIVRPWLIEKSHLTGQIGGSSLAIEYIRADETSKYTTKEDIAPERSN